MPRLAAKDTPAQRQLNIMNAVVRRLDGLEDPEAVARVITWIDGLIDGDTAEEELRAMRNISAQFDGVSADTREAVVRWLNAHYGNGTRQEEVPTE